MTGHMSVGVRAGARRSLAVAVLVGAAACGTPPQPAAQGDGPAAPASPHHGRIRGVVTLKGESPTPQTEPITKDQSVCGSSAPVTRLTLGSHNSVRGAFVYLDGISSAERARPRLSTEIEQKACKYVPHVMTLQTGTDLEIVNDDPILHNVHARQASADGLLTVFNIAQPIRGQRTKVETPLDKPGIVALTCEAGHPWMTAYILVTNHPYVATSGENGEFVIDNVPPGTYPIKMWHEGVRLSRVIPSLQIFEYEEPYEAAETVVVPPDGEAVVDFAFSLRPQPVAAKAN